METALHKWFVLISERDDMTDSLRLAYLTATGTSLLEVANTQLEMIAFRAAPVLLENALEENETDPVVIANYNDYNQWQSVLAMMAAEMYIKAGRVGATTVDTPTFKATLLSDYSGIAKIGIQRLRKVGNPKRND
jgi:hypothetical protein